MLRVPRVALAGSAECQNPQVTGVLTAASMYCRAGIHTLIHDYLDIRGLLDYITLSCDKFNLITSSLHNFVRLSLLQLDRFIHP